MSYEPAFGRGRLRPAGAQVEFLCECGDSGCREHVPLEAAEYERLRAKRGIALAPGHVWPGPAQNEVTEASAGSPAGREAAADPAWGARPV